MKRRSLAIPISGISLAALLTVSTVMSLVVSFTLPQKANAVTDTFTSSGTWTSPAGVTSVTVEAWGGGGGGGGTAANASGGGGGGAYVSSDISVTPSTNYTVTVGGGGSPGAAGGDSWFSTNTTVLAKGGATGTATTGGTGGTGAASIGDTKYSGGTGGDQSGNGKGGGGGGGSATTTGIGGNGTTGNSGGTGGTGQGAGGTGGSNNTAGTNGSAPGGGGGGGGAGAASGSGARGEVIITYTVPVISVAISDGTVSYGAVTLGTSADTTSGGLNDTQSATNDGTATENFNIRGQDSANWTLAASAGSEQYAHAFCTAGSGSPDPCDASPTWTQLTTSYQTLAAGVAVSGTQRFDLRLSVPTTTSTSAQQNVDVTIQAVIP